MKYSWFLILVLVSAIYLVGASAYNLKVAQKVTDPSEKKGLETTNSVNLVIGVVLGLLTIPNLLHQQQIGSVHTVPGVRQLLLDM